LTEATALSAASLSAHPAASWEPRRQLTLEQARRRSSAVLVWRWLFTAIAAAAVLAVIGCMIADSLGASLGLVNRLSVDEALRVTNPKFNGRDHSGVHYVITADAAVRRSMTSDLIDLENPRYANEAGRQMTAPAGSYDQAKRTIELRRKVVFLTQTGDRFETTSAHIDIDANTMRGAAPITGTGKTGDVRADSYEILENGGLLKLHGRVRGLVRESPPHSPTAPAGASKP
jgi:lipopolysaccharide export system protein LptC